MLRMQMQCSDGTPSAAYAMRLLHWGEGLQSGSSCTCLAINLDFLNEEFLKFANLHNFVLHWLCAVDCKGLRLPLASSWSLGLLLQNLHHGCLRFQGASLPKIADFGGRLTVLVTSKHSKQVF